MIDLFAQYLARGLNFNVLLETQCWFGIMSGPRGHAGGPRGLAGQGGGAAEGARGPRLLLLSALWFNMFSVIIIIISYIVIMIIII